MSVARPGEWMNGWIKLLSGTPSPLTLMAVYQSLQDLRWHWDWEDAKIPLPTLGLWYVNRMRIP